MIPRVTPVGSHMKGSYMIYKIENMNAFCKSLGKNVAKEAGFSKKELRKYIKVANIKNMVKYYATVGDDGSFTIDDRRTAAVCDEVLGWLVGVELASAAADGILDCYWDDKTESMVFSHIEEKEQNDDLA